MAFFIIIRCDYVVSLFFFSYLFSSGFSLNCFQRSFISKVFLSVFCLNLFGDIFIVECYQKLSQIYFNIRENIFAAVYFQNISLISEFICSLSSGFIWYRQFCSRCHHKSAWTASDTNGLVLGHKLTMTWIRLYYALYHYENQHIDF